ASRRELGDERVRTPAQRLIGAGRGRKVRRARRARDVEVPGRVAREVNLAVEVYPGLVAGAAEIRRVRDDRVDDEPSRSVVVAQPEPDLSFRVERVLGCDRPAYAADPLVRDRPWLPDVAGGRVHHERALAVHLDVIGAVDAETDLVRIDAGCNDEVVLQAAGARVVHEVDAGVDIVVSDATVRRRADGRVDAAAGEVADDSRKQTASRHPRPGVRADPLP